MTLMSMRDMAPWSRDGSRAPAAFRGEPASLFATLRQEMDRVFDEALRGFGISTTGFGGGWPRVDVTENGKEIRASFEVPGVDEKDIEVLLDGGDLVVRGEKRAETENKERRFRICTRNNPAFRSEVGTESGVGPVSPCRTDVLRRHFERRWFITDIRTAMIS